MNKLNKKANGTEKLTEDLIKNSKEVYEILKEIEKEGKISEKH